MLSASRCVGATPRPIDLGVITKSRGSLERLKVAHSPSDTNAVHVSERISNTAGEADATQRSSLSQHSQIPAEGAKGRALISSVPPSTEFGKVEAQSAAASHINPTFFVRSTSQHSSAFQQMRGFHTSPPVPYDSTSYNVANVPDFFVKYKQQRATSTTGPEAHGRKHELLGLMPTLTDSVLAGDVIATTRRLKAKIPVEHQVPEGHIIHPSGFVVPGPGHTSSSDVARAKERERNENKDRAVQTKAVAHRVSESDFEQVDATTLPSQHKVPFEVREPDGTVKHPSGFVPPTPAHKFRYIVSSNVLRDRKVSDARQKARQPSPARTVLRAMHTSSAPKARGDV